VVAALGESAMLRWLQSLLTNIFYAIHWGRMQAAIRVCLKAAMQSSNLCVRLDVLAVFNHLMFLPDAAGTHTERITQLLQW